MVNTENRIINKIKKAKGGTLFFIENFLSYGNNEAIKKSLQPKN